MEWERERAGVTSRIQAAIAHEQAQQALQEDAMVQHEVSVAREEWDRDQRQERQGWQGEMSALRRELEEALRQVEALAAPFPEAELPALPAGSGSPRKEKLGGEGTISSHEASLSESLQMYQVR